MRIIAGKAAGRRLKSPTGQNVRPLMDRVREALFNILGEAVIDACFLDLFAGSGAVGIEALSRGAALAFFVEKDRRTLPTLRQNLEITGLKEYAEVYPLDVLRALKVFARRQIKFKLIFVGAPYQSPLLLKTLQELDEFNLLANNGMIIAERQKNLAVDLEFQNLILIEERKYGDTVLSFYQPVNKL